MSNRVRAYRRIATVNGVEVHRGTSLEKLGLWEGTYISEADRLTLEQDPHTLTFVIRELEPGGEIYAEGITGVPGSTRTYRVVGGIRYRVDALLIATIEAEQAQLVLVESVQSGKGTEIVRAFEKYVKSQGIKTVYLVSVWHAKRFWEKMGYEFIADNSDEAFKELTW